MKAIFLVAAGVLLLCGCSSDSSSAGSSGTKEFAQEAWGAFNFARNAANPVYYAKKAANAGYSKYKESKAASGE